MSDLQEISGLVDELYRLPFPKEAYLLDWELDLTLLDTECFGMFQQYVAFGGCRDSFYNFYKEFPNSSPGLSAPAMVALKKYQVQLKAVLPRLTGEALSYFGLHETILKLIIQSLENPESPILASN